MKFPLAVGLLLASFLLSGCAYTYAVPITEENKNSSGFRIYGTKPILVISPTEISVQYIPNYSKEYAVRFGAFLAKNDIKFSLRDAQTVSEITANMDGTALVSNFFDFAKEAVKAGSKSALGALVGSESSSGRKVGVFEFVFDSQGNIERLKPLFTEEDGFDADRGFITLPQPVHLRDTPDGDGGGGDADENGDGGDEGDPLKDPKES